MSPKDIPQPFSTRFDPQPTQSQVFRDYWEHQQLCKAAEALGLPSPRSLLSPPKRAEENPDSLVLGAPEVLEMLALAQPHALYSNFAAFPRLAVPHQQKCPWPA